MYYLLSIGSTPDFFKIMVCQAQRTHALPYCRGSIRAGVTHAKNACFFDHQIHIDRVRHTCYKPGGRSMLPFGPVKQFYTYYSIHSSQVSPPGDQHTHHAYIPTSTSLADLVQALAVLHAPHDALALGHVAHTHLGHDVGRAGALLMGEERRRGGGGAARAGPRGRGGVASRGLREREREREIIKTQPAASYYNSSLLP